MKRLLIIEDGDEYTEFARLFLSDAFHLVQAHSASEALASLDDGAPDALLVDLRFDRAPQEVLVGDVAATATRLFGGDRTRAMQYLQEQQGTLVLGELRSVGCAAPALFVHDFPPRRLENLRRLYGDVSCVPTFDAGRIRAALGVG